MYSLHTYTVKLLSHISIYPYTNTHIQFACRVGGMVTENLYIILLRISIAERKNGSLLCTGSQPKQPRPNNRVLTAVRNSCGLLSESDPTT